MLILQLHTSNVRENANQRSSIQFQKFIEKKIRTSFFGYLNQVKQSGDEKYCFFFEKKIVFIKFPCMKIIWLAFFDGDNKNFTK